MNCPSCGKETRPGASFCGECGAKLVATATGGAAPVETPIAAAPMQPPSPAPAAGPLLVVPPPPPGVPKEVEIVPFGTTGNLPAPETTASTITITSPPGMGSPPSAPSDPVGSVGAAPIVVVPATAESLDETRVSARRSSSNRWRLVLPDARQIEVSGAILVGREPSANPKWPGATFLTISDDGNSISKTHSVFEADATGLWVTDLDSTNGVVIIQADGVELDLAPNVRTLVQPGADVELGDFVVQVEKD